MKIAAIAAMMMTAAANAVSGKNPVPLELSRDARVIAAMTTAWGHAFGSAVHYQESGFRVDDKGRDIEIVPSRCTGEQMEQTMSIVAGKTVAIYHVHPKGSDPKPSLDDRKIADEYGVQVYTIHLDGLYVYDPATKRTVKLADGLNWMRRESGNRN